MGDVDARALGNPPMAGWLGRACNIAMLLPGTLLSGTRHQHQVGRCWRCCLCRRGLGRGAPFSARPQNGTSSSAGPPGAYRVKQMPWPTRSNPVFGWHTASPWARARLSVGWPGKMAPLYRPATVGGPAGDVRHVRVYSVRFGRRPCFGCSRAWVHWRVNNKFRGYFGVLGGAMLEMKGVEGFGEDRLFMVN